MTELGEAYRKESGLGISVSYGPSGKLRENIEQGRQADVFASASVEHTAALAAKKLLSRSVTFAYNELCVVSTPALGLTEANLVETLLKPAVRLATSTPVSDPMGDYTWQFFRNADKAQPGAFTRFDTKALKLSGASAPAPGQKLPYVTVFEDGKADAYVMYCTNAASTLRALPDLKVLRIPDALNVRGAVRRLVLRLGMAGPADGHCRRRAGRRMGKEPHRGDRQGATGPRDGRPGGRGNSRGRGSRRQSRRHQDRRPARVAHRAPVLLLRYWRGHPRPVPDSTRSA
jgi:molybdate transport system substrate-binding protein